MFPRGHHCSNALVHDVMLAGMTTKPRMANGVEMLKFCNLLAAMTFPACVISVLLLHCL